MFSPLFFRGRFLWLILFLLVLNAACNALDSNSLPPDMSEKDIANKTLSSYSTPTEQKFNGQLSYLLDHVGEYPDGAFFDVEPLHSRLTDLLLDNYLLLPLRFGVVAPIVGEDDIIWMEGLSPHRGGLDDAMILVDLKNDAIRVLLRVEGEILDFKEDNWLLDASNSPPLLSERLSIFLNE